MKNMNKKITEGEITSLVRKYFKANGFRFLSTLSNGEKLYYTAGGNTSNNKQPDSIVWKKNLIIICEDKILFSSLFSERNESINDFLKLTTFLNPELDKAIFIEKIRPMVSEQDIKLVGCLGSLSPEKQKKPEFISDILIYLSISFLLEDTFKVSLFAKETIRAYFNHLELEIKL